MKLNECFTQYSADYANYVILHRAIPSAYDGLKPVQRRILHAMSCSDDGRYTKVANIVGDTMKYHPHGDSSIEGALVQVGQKGFLVDPQGNWGNIFTGDNAAASRYIEARLTPLAKNYGFNKKTTRWDDSYDGRNKEPIELPMKLPLLLMSGAEGIGVGLRTTILPHNPIELCNAAISYINKEEYSLIPDFPTGGSLDATNYNEGKAGGKVRVRAKMRPYDGAKNCIEIYELPFSKNTNHINESISKVANSGKLPIKKIENNTAEFVSILVYYDKNEEAENIIQGLYALTDCETSISTECWVIKDKKPVNPGVNELLGWNVEYTKALIKRELEILLEELNEKKRRCCIEKLFIENDVYEQIKESTDKANMTIRIDLPMIELCNDYNTKEGFDPQYQAGLEGDSNWLSAIPFRRLSKYDSQEAIDKILSLDKEIRRTINKLKNIKQETVKHFNQVLNDFSEYKRKTEIREFKTKNLSKVARQVVKATDTLYVNKQEGIIGTDSKIGEELNKCSNLSLVATLNKEGKFKVVPVGKKVFVNTNIMEVCIHNPDEEQVFTMVYVDTNGITYAKRFEIGSYTRSKDYIITKSKTGAKVLFTHLGKKEENLPTLKIKLDKTAKARKKELDFNLNEISIKSRASGGNIVTKFAIESIT